MSARVDLAKAAFPGQRGIGPPADAVAGALRLDGPVVYVGSEEIDGTERSCLFPNN